jgi:queuine tRNA-ribosyltransferase
MARGPGSGFFGPEGVAVGAAVTIEVVHRDVGTRARAGLLRTPHGVVETPAFMPVGTQGTVKGLTPEVLEEIGSRMVLANTYHLALRPGEEVVAALGGLHRFMGWGGPILTDSGGFQAFSLAQRRKLTERGVAFRSHIDGRALELTPERAVAIQEALGRTWRCAWTTALPCRRRTRRWRRRQRGR